MAYGCFNREPYLPQQVLEDHHGRVVAVMPHVMRKDCAYTETILGQEDKKCLGCRWRKTPLNTCPEFVK